MIALPEQVIGFARNRRSPWPVRARRAGVVKHTGSYPGRATAQDLRRAAVSLDTRTCGEPETVRFERCAARVPDVEAERYIVAGGPDQER